MSRFDADGGAGFRANVAGFGPGAPASQRGGFGAEQDPSADQSQDMVSTQMQGNPHSSRGFRRALMRTQRSEGGTLKGDIANRTHFGGKGFRKPNYFGQGGKRHGMHIGAGAPYTAGAEQGGADT